ncbi:Secondary metabolism regulator LAE1 [Colletotrichum orbiculare MAFF 240422]|uniref:Secondary metabolism regulator LAE1 n=1 Tax=Colletotrichum orbiculare (strain 104-T / ATCC 96160 / CBS 514.97 / LARS 414 / MAFF 240422) TaxID=1213857 RepID=N4VJZ0_COLOR|nr:Secondary metabolism regulator LAE1 [Colletotrichum orbiculare MAFF 240422]
MSAAAESPNVLNVDETHIDVDGQGSDDASSDLDGSLASSRASIASSIYNYRTENGRTYHRYKEGKYSYPNDEKENERLDLQHELFFITLNGKLGLARPNEEDSEAKRVLDVGTGTGLWAIDYGELHENAEVIGVDLSPPPAEVPPNVRFDVDDIDEPWTYSQPFDYIHSRMMTSSIASWPDYLQNCYNNLKPGAYLELQEVDFSLGLQSDDDSLKADSALYKSMDFLSEALERFGRPFQDIPALVNIMTDIGFVDVVITKFKWPINTWPKDQHYKTIGAWNLANSLEGIEGWVMAPFTRALNWKKEEVEIFLVDVRKEFKDRNIHAYYPIYVVYGKRPEEKTTQGHVH